MSLHVLQSVGWKRARTCRHIKEEGEDAPSVIASPQDPPRSIKGKRQHAACQLTGAPFNLLPSRDIHHLQVMLAVPYLEITTGGEDQTFAVYRAAVQN